MLLLSFVIKLLLLLLFGVEFLLVSVMKPLLVFEMLLVVTK